MDYPKFFIFGVIHILILFKISTINAASIDDQNRNINRQNFTLELISKFTERPTISRSDNVNSGGIKSRSLIGRRWRKQPNWDFNIMVEGGAKFRELPFFEVNGEKYIGIPVPLDETGSIETSMTGIKSTSSNQMQPQIYTDKGTYESGTIYPQIVPGPMPFAVQNIAISPSLSLPYYRPKAPTPYGQTYGILQQNGYNFNTYGNPSINYFAKLPHQQFFISPSAYLQIPNIAHSAQKVTPTEELNPPTPFAPTIVVPPYSPNIQLNIPTHPWRIPITTPYLNVPHPYSYIVPIITPQVQDTTVKHDELLSVEANKAQIMNGQTQSQIETGNNNGFLSSSTLLNSNANGNVLIGQNPSILPGPTIAQTDLGIQQIQEPNQPVLQTVSSMNELNDHKSSSLFTKNQDSSILSSTKSEVGSTIDGILNAVGSSISNVANSGSSTGGEVKATEYQSGGSINVQDIIDNIGVSDVYNAGVSKVQSALNSATSSVISNLNTKEITDSIESSSSAAYDSGTSNAESILNAVKLSEAEAMQMQSAGTEANLQYSTQQGGSIGLNLSPAVISSGLSVATDEEGSIASVSTSILNDKSSASSNSQSATAAEAYDEAFLFNGVPTKSTVSTSSSSASSDQSYSYSTSSATSSASTQEVLSTLSI